VAGPTVTRLPKAPLLEVATQVRWGVAERGEDNEFLRYHFTHEEETQLPADLSRVFSEAGFAHVDPIFPELSDVQFAVSQRYRPDPDGWPVYQSGLGVFTVHESNDNYDWEKYKQDTLRGLELLTDTLLPYYPEGIPFVGIELLYTDRFLLDEGEEPDAFLKKKLALRYRIPNEFGSAPFIKQGFSSASLSFEMNLTEPDGSIGVAIQYADVFSRPAYIMDTRVLSVGAAAEYTPHGFATWMEAAHRVQQHAFRTLIEPDLHGSFQE
jgi:uncharacterized protein (TIGR04255 family)